MELNHKNLCDIAVKWLQRPYSQKGPACNFAVAEVASGWSGEIPDAIGFRMSGGGDDGSHLVEVKVSRSDFLSDAKKPHRSGETVGMGNWRYYMCPVDLIKPEELPPKWGLLYVNTRGHVKSIVSPFLNNSWNYRTEALKTMFFKSDYERETFLLVRLLARLGDVEKYNEDLKAARRENSRLVKLCNEQKKALRDSQHESRRLRRALEVKEKAA